MADTTVRSGRKAARPLPLFGETPEGELARLREAIDRVDEVLVKLINQRVRYAIEIGAMKRVTRQAIHSPEREREVLANVSRWSGGPLDADAIRRVFELLISESRRIEAELAAEEG
ncbi:MAG TPA: chorismate mutase [Thermoanaerobaculia bacterium]|nr:chorismate mutase [Thermoanaerobaculia bacterium]